MKSLPGFRRNAGAAGKQQEVVAVSFTADTVKIVSARLMPYRKEVIRAGSVSIAGKSDAEAVEAIQVLAEDLGIRRTDVTVVVSSQVVITKNIEIPSRDSREIREIVNLQAGRHTPYSREEIIADYLDIGAFKQSYSKILLVIVSRGAIKKHIDLLDRSGLRPDRVVMGGEAISWALSKILRFEAGEHPVAVVHVDAQASDFIVVLRGRSIFVRSISIGARQLNDEKEKYAMKFVEEIRRSIEAYQSEDIERKPGTLVLTGAVTETGTLESMLVSEIALNVKVLTYANHMACAGALQQQLAADKENSYLPMAACLFAGPDLVVDLSPEDVRLRKALERRGKELIKAGVLMMGIFVFACAVFAVKIGAKGAYLRKVDAQYKVSAAKVQELEKDFSKIGLIRTYFMYQGYSLEVLTELAVIAPDSMLFNDIRFDNEAGKVSIRGTTDSMASVFSFSENLDKSEYFKDVQVKNTTKRKDGERDVTDFELACQIQRAS